MHIVVPSPSPSPSPSLSLPPSPPSPPQVIYGRNPNDRTGEFTFFPVPIAGIAPNQSEDEANAVGWQESDRERASEKREREREIDRCDVM